MRDESEQRQLWSMSVAWRCPSQSILSARHAGLEAYLSCEDDAGLVLELVLVLVLVLKAYLSCEDDAGCVRVSAGGIPVV